MVDPPRRRARTGIASPDWWLRLPFLPLVIVYAFVLPEPVNFFCLPLGCWTLAAVGVTLGRYHESLRWEGFIFVAVGVCFLSGTITWLLTSSVGLTLLWTFVIPFGVTMLGFVVFGVVTGVRNSRT
ncbi:hypothetical protein [Pseudonocardia sp. TRM90224]|uniref:hypothetical protein n=1 Tax=Pseudonocardia sp. TRM90224 TaxID=2812678 RepID=UPI001E5B7D0D|nr:hypothetical protein [Pseudonocardia sp. TRM90224]